MEGQKEIEARNLLAVFNQSIQAINSQININLNNDKILLKLLNELNHNSTLIENILDTSRDNNHIENIAKLGKEIIDELEHKIKEQDRNIEALLQGEFKKIRNYYLAFSSKEKKGFDFRSSKRLNRIKGSAFKSRFFTKQAPQIYSNTAIANGDNSFAAVLLPNIPPAESLPLNWHVPNGTENFIPRKSHLTHEDLLTKLNQLLNSSAANETTNVAVCYGMGGVGKTQLAIQLTKLCRKNYGTGLSICWFSADTSEQLIKDYIALGKELHILQADEDEQIDPKELAMRVKTWIENRTPATWLLVYDNAKDHKDISDLLPTMAMGGKILITSRYTEWPWSTLKLETYTSEESNAYLQKIIGEYKDRDNSEELVDKLGSLPLALAQAAHYIRRNKISIATYLKTYRTAKQFLLNENKLPPNENHQAVAITWDITINAMIKECPNAVELLKLCCYLYYQDIPHEVIKEFFSSDNNPVAEALIANALSVAEEYSMLTRNTEKETVSIHCLVQEVYLIKEQIPEIGFLIKTVSAVTKAYDGRIPNYKSRYTFKLNFLTHLEIISKKVDIIRYALQLFLKKDEVSATVVINMFESDTLIPLYLCMFDVYEEIGNAILQRKAKKNTEIILEKHYKQFGKDDYNQAFELLNKWGNAYRLLGDTATAKKIYEDLLDITKKVWGENHISECWPLKMLALIDAETDKQRADELLQRAKNIAIKELGPKHIAIAEILGDQSYINLKNNTLKKAKELAEEAYAIVLNYPNGGEECELAVKIKNLLDDIEFSAHMKKNIGFSGDDEIPAELKVKCLGSFYEFMSELTYNNIFKLLTLYSLIPPCSSDIYIFPETMTEQSCIDLFCADEETVKRLSQIGIIYIIVLQPSNFQVAFLIFDNRDQYQPQINYLDLNGKGVSRKLLEIIENKFASPLKSNKINHQVEGSELDIMIPDLMAKFGVLAIRLLLIYLAIGRLPEEKELENSIFDIKNVWEEQKSLLNKFSRIKEVKHNFVFCSQDAHTIHVAGNFNNWLNAVDGKIDTKNNDNWLMKKNNDDFKWELEICFPPGTYAFKYVINGGERWETDYDYPCYGGKNKNSILVMKPLKSSKENKKEIVKDFNDPNINSAKANSNYLPQKLVHSQKSVVNLSLTGVNTMIPVENIESDLNQVKFPTPYEHAIMSKLAYYDDPSKLPSDKEYNQERDYFEFLKARGWVLAKVVKENDYYGYIWLNEKRQQITISHRGSQNATSWITDIESVIKLKPGTFIHSAIKLLSDKIVISNREKGFRLTTTGHSLAGFLSIVLVFWSHRREFKKTYYPNISANVFDSPGVVEFFKVLAPNIESEKDSIDVKTLNVHNFCATPTLVSTYGTHTGTVWHLSGAENETFAFVNDHRMVNILKGFDPNTGLPSNFRQMIDWPQADYSAYGSVTNTLEHFAVESLKAPFNFLNYLYKNYLKRAQTDTWYDKLFSNDGEVTLFLSNPSNRPTPEELSKKIYLAIKSHYAFKDVSENRKSIGLFHFDREVQIFLSDFIFSKKAGHSNLGLDADLIKLLGEEGYKLLLQFDLKTYGSKTELVLKADYPGNIFDYLWRVQTLLKVRGIPLIPELIGSKINALTAAIQEVKDKQGEESKKLQEQIEKLTEQKSTVIKGRTLAFRSVVTEAKDTLAMLILDGKAYESARLEEAKTMLPHLRDGDLLAMDSGIVNHEGGAVILMGQKPTKEQDSMASNLLSIWSQRKNIGGAANPTTSLSDGTSEIEVISQPPEGIHRPAKK